jgi:hypothetical protein
MLNIAGMSVACWLWVNPYSSVNRP